MSFSSQLQGRGSAPVYLESIGFLAVRFLVSFEFFFYHIPHRFQLRTGQRTRCLSKRGLSKISLRESVTLNAPSVLTQNLPMSVFEELPASINIFWVLLNLHFMESPQLFSQPKWQSIYSSSMHIYSIYYNRMEVHDILEKTITCLSVPAICGLLVPSSF